MKAGQRFSGAQAAKFASLENRLSGIFKTVPPRKEFVRGLSERIQAGNHASFVNHVASWHFFVMLIASLASLIILVVVSVRALLTLFGKKHPQTG